MGYTQRLKLPAQDSEQRIPDLCQAGCHLFCQARSEGCCQLPDAGVHGGFVEGMSRECVEAVSAAGWFLQRKHWVTFIMEKKSIHVRGKEAEEGSVESVHLMRGTAHQGVGDVLLCQLALGMVITWVGQAGAAPSPPVCCQP